MNIAYTLLGGGCCVLNAPEPHTTAVRIPAQSCGDQCFPLDGAALLAVFRVGLRISTRR